MRTSATNFTQGNQEQGFALPLVVIIGLFLMIGGFAILARTFGTFQGSIKNNHQQQAQELAEEGVSKIIDQLNSSYRYLWVNCHNSTNGACSQTNVGGWNNSSNEHGGDLPIIKVASCLDIKANQNPPRTTGNYSDLLELGDKVNDAGQKAKRGTWSLESYTFNGNPWTGGRGVIRVKGERINSNDVATASAVIDHHIQIIGKPCQQKLTEKFSKSTFPGLLAEKIDLGNNDVLGDPSANVYCTECTDTSGIIQKPGSIVDGDLFTGTVTLPPVPTFPPSLRGNVEPGDLTQDTKIDPPHTPLTTFNPTGYQQTGSKPMCVTDQKEPPVSHCLVGTIDLQGGRQKKLTVYTDPSPNETGIRAVRLYVGGDISATGRSSIVNAGTSTSFTSLSIFGPQSCPTPNQSISVGGGASVKAFIYAPCATVGVNGGSGRASCQQPGQAPQDFGPNSPANPDETTCSGGDFDGVVWAKEWKLSGSNNGELTVPQDAESELITTFGEQFSVGPSDFVGVGVPRWTSYQEPQ